MFHRDTGSVLGADESLTTLVITGTVTDLRTQSFIHTTTTAAPGEEEGGDDDDIEREGGYPPRKPRPDLNRNRTAAPRTITQGPGTFEYTATRGRDKTVVNRCHLEGQASAECNVTHVGKGWYTKKQPDFVGEWSTYNFTWTSGGRYGFAPVTLTAGLEKLPKETAPPPDVENDGGEEGTGSGSVREMLHGAGAPAAAAAVLVGFVLGAFAII